MNLNSGAKGETKIEQQAGILLDITSGSGVQNEKQAQSLAIAPAWS